jgi:predicted peptidase
LTIGDFYYIIVLVKYFSEAAMSFEAKEFKDIKYYIRYPDDYKSGEKYPVIFLFHGAGSRGDKLEGLENNPYFKLAYSHKEFSFVTVAPKCNKNTWFDHFETVKELIKETLNADFADADRIYAVGPSMGGYMTWQIAMSMPEVFAAAIPICGGGMYWNTSRLKNMPIWAFHGALDTTVLPEETIKMVNAINARGENAKLTIYDDVQHASWVPAYSDPETFRWLFSHKKSDGTLDKDQYTDSKIYG